MAKVAAEAEDGHLDVHEVVEVVVVLTVPMLLNPAIRIKNLQLFGVVVVQESNQMQMAMHHKKIHKLEG